MARFLGIFCIHEWEEEERASIIARSRVVPSQAREVGVAVVLKCKCCGDMKLKRLSVA